VVETLAVFNPSRCEQAQSPTTTSVKRASGLSGCSKGSLMGQLDSLSSIDGVRSTGLTD
jgi:hypothetical protein